MQRQETDTDNLSMVQADNSILILNSVSVWKSNGQESEKKKVCMHAS
jgi:hypothetical protein